MDAVSIFWIPAVMLLLAGFLFAIACLSSALPSFKHDEELVLIHSWSKKKRAVAGVLVLACCLTAAYGTYRRFCPTEKNKAHAEALQIIAELDEIVEAMEEGDRLAILEKFPDVRRRMEALPPLPAQDRRAMQLRISKLKALNKKLGEETDKYIMEHYPEEVD